MHGITAVPISWSLVAQAGLLENLGRLDTMILEEIAEIGRNRSRIAGLRARLASSARGAEVTPGSSGIARVCRRALVGVASELAGASVLDESES
jgi:hypothetical protein